MMGSPTAVRAARGVTAGTASHADQRSFLDPRPGCYPAAVVSLFAVLFCLTVYRVTRLLTEDKIPIIATPRAVLYNWLDPDPSEVLAGRRKPTGGTARAAAYLLTCPWCMSVWVGGIAALAVDHWLHIPYVWWMWPASSAVTGLLAAAEGLAERHYELTEARTALARSERLLIEAQTKQARLTLPESMR